MGCARAVAYALRVASRPHPAGAHGRSEAWDREDIVDAYEELRKIVAERLVFERTARNLTQVQLAELAALHPTRISKLENAKNNFQCITLAALATALKIPVVRLLTPVGSKE
jgi:ribosome-binding protein aMBF1 (putative translation factor)